MLEAMGSHPHSGGISCNNYGTEGYEALVALHEWFVLAYNSCYLHSICIFTTLSGDCKRILPRPIIIASPCVRATCDAVNIALVPLKKLVMHGVLYNCFGMNSFKKTNADFRLLIILFIELSLSIMFFTSLLLDFVFHSKLAQDLFIKSQPALDIRQP